MAQSASTRSRSWSLGPNGPLVSFRVTMPIPAYTKICGFSGTVRGRTDAQPSPAPWTMPVTYDGLLERSSSWNRDRFDSNAQMPIKLSRATFFIPVRPSPASAIGSTCVRAFQIIVGYRLSSLPSRPSSMLMEPRVLSRAPLTPGQESLYSSYNQTTCT